MDAPTNTFQLLPLAQVRESKLNPRRRFNEQQLAELAESIRQHGIITPLIVRQVNGHYELAAGHRRRRAAELAGLEAVPAMIRELSDQQFLEVLTIENDQREDVHPLEQAEGYQRLLKLKGYTVELVAEKIGRDASYVYRRLHLLKLIDPAKEAFLDGRIQIGHALKLAPLDPAVQAKAFKGMFRTEQKWSSALGKHVRIGDVVSSPSELEAWIRTEVYLDLARAVFAKDDPDLLPSAGACTACTKRTGANLALFDDTKKGDHCLDRACFHRKQNAHLVQLEGAAKAEGVTLLRITTSYGTKKALYHHHVNVIKAGKGKCDSTERAVYVDGPNVGKQVDICVGKSCSKHGGRHSFSGSGREKKTFAELWRERKEKLDKKIEWVTRRRVLAAILDRPLDWSIPDQAVLLIIDRLASSNHSADVCSLLGIPVEKAKGKYVDYRQSLDKHVEGSPPAEQQRILMGLALVDGAKEFCWKESADYRRLQAAAESCGVQWADIGRAVDRELRVEFDAKKAKAEAAHKKKQAAKASAPAKGKKKAAAKPDAKRRAANDVDDELGIDPGYEDAGV